MSDLRLGLPSKGSIHEPTIRFLAACGLSVRRTSQRHYIGEMGGMGTAQVLFLHAAEIPEKVAAGICDVGFTGVDLVRENPQLSRGLVWLFDGLGYGGARLVLAVPEAWRDVDSLSDIVEIAAQWKAEHGRKIRVATKFTSLTRAFLLANGISDHVLVRSSGATELSSWLKDADIIADLTSSGATLVANRLKEIEGGTVLESEACLIANRGALSSDESRLQTVRGLVGRIEARLLAQRTYVLEAVCDRAKTEAEGAGTDAAAWVVGRANVDDQTTALTLHVPRGELDAAMRALRRLDLAHCRTFEPTFLFEHGETAFGRLLASLKQTRDDE